MENFLFDVAIIGAGPAGIFSSLYLSENTKNLKIALIDKKNYIGGLGTRTDGKLNLSPDIGMNLDELKIDRAFAEEIIDYIDKKFTSFEELELLSTDEEKVKFWKDKIEAQGLTFVYSKQRHMGTDRAYRIMNSFKSVLEANGVSMYLGKEVLDIVKEGDYFILVFEDAIIRCKYLVVAPGRTGMYWFRNLADKIGLSWNYGHIDIGLRVELDAKILEEITDVIYDPKIKYITSSHGDKVRTFCTNPHGFVTIEDFTDFKLVNGHAFYNKKSNNTNFAVLQTIGLHAPFVDTTMYGRNIAMNVNLLGGGKPLLQRLGDLLRGRRTKFERFYEYGNLEPTLSYGNGSSEIEGVVTLGDISMVYSRRILDNLLEFLQKLDTILPGTFHPETLIYAPEIKFYDVQYLTSQFMETNIKDLFVAGDGVGKSRGIVGASLTGVLAAMGIIANYKEGK